MKTRKTLQSAAFFKDTNIDKEYKQDKKRKKLEEKVNSSITLDKPVLKMMKIYLSIKGQTLSSFINNYLKNEYIPKNNVKEIVEKIKGLNF